MVIVVVSTCVAGDR